MTRTLTLLASFVLIAGCSPSDNNGTPDGGDPDTGSAVSNMATDMGTAEDAGGGSTDMGTAADAGGGSTDMGSADQGAMPDTGGDEMAFIVENAGNCFELSNDIDDPLAIDGVFGPDSNFWRRPLPVDDLCPAEELTPEDKAATPYIAFAFCNTDSVDHLYDFELVAQESPEGDPEVDDPYLVLYEGEEPPADLRQCLAANDDIPDAFDTGDSEILGLTVPAGSAVTVVSTTFTYEEATNVGTGAYILIVTNAD